MNGMEVLEIKKEEDWTSKKELMEICKCSDKTLEQIISSFNIETGFDIKNHIKKGGYRNLEVFYFPTTMVSESGIDKIYDCFDR